MRNARRLISWPLLTLDVALEARIDFEVTSELATEAGHFDGLALAQTAHVYPGRGADERMNFARSIVDEDDEPEWQVVDDGPGDRSPDSDELAFGGFAHGSCGNRERVHFRPAPVRFDVRQIDEHEQTRQDGVGKLAGDTHLLSRREPQVVGNADVDAARVILNGKALIEGTRTKRAGRHGNGAVDGDDCS